MKKGKTFSYVTFLMIDNQKIEGPQIEILCSLRWHYPDQVKGLISARIIKAPRIQYKVKRKSRLNGNGEKKFTFTNLYIYIFIYMQFKQLDLKPQGSWISRTVNAPRFKTSLIAIMVGAILGFLFFYFTEGRLMESIPGKDIIRSSFIGGFFGFFITNSPCARGRC